MKIPAQQQKSNSTRHMRPSWIAGSAIIISIVAIAGTILVFVLQGPELAIGTFLAIATIGGFISNVLGNWLAVLQVLDAKSSRLSQPPSHGRQQYHEATDRVEKSKQRFISDYLIKDDFTAIQGYYNALSEQWGMLDFKGILQMKMKQPVVMPLTDIFIIPDVLMGILPYETWEREDPSWRKEKRDQEQANLRKEDTSGPQNRELLANANFIMQQRESVHTVFAKQRRLVVLGDPGSGKTTLLRYLMLLMREREQFQALFPSFAHSLLIPLYIPITAYAEVWLTDTPGTRSLE